MSALPTPRTRVHLVLGSGGVKTLAYVGALAVLEEAGIEFASISACSAGSLIGALVATGLPMREVQARVEAVDLRRLLGQPSLPGPLRYVSWLRWPFAPYDSDAVVRIMEELIGPGKTFGEMAIPFATAGIDLLSKQLLVYASETHADMKVTEAVRIAVGIPLFFPPHEAGGRVVVDAAIATHCPIWMVGRFDDEFPIVALQPADAPVTTPPQGIGRFIKTIVGAGVASRDHYLIDEIPRARLIEVPVFDLEMEQFDAAQTRKPYLFDAGRRAATACLRDWGNDLSGERRRAQAGSRPADRIHDERAVMTASAMMRGFANRLSRISRSQLFISYSHRDKAWLDVVKAPLEPYVELRGLQVWDDTRIEAGELWRDAIDRALASTRVALLLVSPGFLASPFIRSEELGFFLEAAARYAVKVRWVLLSAIGDAPNPVGHIQAMHDMATPLDALSAPDLVRALAAIGRQLAADLDG